MRIITRGDLDGLTSSAIITSVEEIDGIEFAHPKDMQDGKVAVTNEDIIVNLPFHPSCALWFDHHQGAEEEQTLSSYRGKYGVAPSAARLVFEYYLDRFPAIEKFGELVAETDRVDAAQLTLDDVLNPRRYVLLSYTLDPRTGIGGPYRTYFRHLLDWVKIQPIGDVLRMPEVAERVAEIKQAQREFQKALRSHSKVEGSAVVTDFRRLAERPIGNRFLVYALFPQANVSMTLFRARDPEFVVVALGASVLNRSGMANLGDICARYGGGGHRGAGTCQVPKTKIARVVRHILDELNPVPQRASAGD